MTRQVFTNQEYLLDNYDVVPPNSPCFDSSDSEKQVYLADGGLNAGFLPTSSPPSSVYSYVEQQAYNEWVALFPDIAIEFNKLRVPTATTPLSAHFDITMFTGASWDGICLFPFFFSLLSIRNLTHTHASG